MILKNHKGWCHMIQLNGKNLTIEQMASILYGNQKVAIVDDAKQKVVKAVKLSNELCSKIKQCTVLIQALVSLAMLKL